jgi:uncharacterized membrane protein
VTSRRLGVPLLAAGLLTLWDVALDPAMTAEFPAWTWDAGTGPYGIPCRNWVGWFAVAWLVAFLYDRTVPWRAERPTGLPLALYALQSAFPAVLAAIYGRAGASGVWAVGFTLLVGSCYRRLWEPRHGKVLERESGG